MEIHSPLIIHEIAKRVYVVTNQLIYNIPNIINKVDTRSGSNKFGVSAVKLVLA